MQAQFAAQMQAMLAAATGLTPTAAAAAALPFVATPVAASSSSSSAAVATPAASTQKKAKKAKADAAAAATTPAPASSSSSASSAAIVPQSPFAPLTATQTPTAAAATPFAPLAVPFSPSPFAPLSASAAPSSSSSSSSSSAAAPASMEHMRLDVATSREKLRECIAGAMCVVDRADQVCENAWAWMVRSGSDERGILWGQMIGQSSLYQMRGAIMATPTFLRNVFSIIIPFSVAHSAKLKKCRNKVVRCLTP
jgi:hypothetical protein